MMNENLARRNARGERPVTHLFSRRWLSVLFVLSSLPASSVYLLAAQDTPTDEPASEDTPLSIEVEYAVGDFNLLSPTVGLSDLTSYRATLTLSFDGTQAG